MSVRYRQIACLSAGAMLVFGLGPAVAAEADEVAERLTAMLSKNGIEIAWENASQNGDDIIIEGVSAGVENERIEIGALLLSDVTETDGTYRIAELSLPSYQRQQDGITLSISDFSFSGIVLPPEDGEKNLRSIMPYEGVTLKSVQVTGPNGDIFSLENFTASSTVPTESEPSTFTGGAERFVLNTSAFPEAEARALFAALGYSTIEGSLSMDGMWNPSDGRTTIDAMVLAVENAGALSLGLDLSGYTPEFIESLQMTSRKMREGGDDQGGLAMLGLMQQVNFHSARIRFEDDSLTQKILEFVAAQQGMKPSDIANQAKAIIPFAMAQLNNPEFTTEVTLAVSNYLDDPKSIEITATPSTPMPIAMLIASGMSAPESLPNQLGVKVEANSCAAGTMSC